MTLSLVSNEMRLLPFNTMETVPFVTPAFFAMSFMVTFFIFAPCYSTLSLSLTLPLRAGLKPALKFKGKAKDNGDKLNPVTPSSLRPAPG
jgi:hypothetical protein